MRQSMATISTLPSKFWCNLLIQAVLGAGSSSIKVRERVLIPLPKHLKIVWTAVRCVQSRNAVGASLS